MDALNWKRFNQGIYLIRVQGTVIYKFKVLGEDTYFLVCSCILILLFRFTAYKYRHVSQNLKLVTPSLISFQMVPRSMWPLTLDFKTSHFMTSSMEFFTLLPRGASVFLKHIWYFFFTGWRGECCIMGTEGGGTIIRRCKYECCVYSVPDVWGYEIYNWTSKCCLTNYSMGLVRIDS